MNAIEISSIVKRYGEKTAVDHLSLAVPEGEFFVMGDHRNNSNDSRATGSITRDMIVGHVRRVVYPFNQWRGIPNGLDVSAE